MYCLVCLQELYTDVVTWHEEEEGHSMLKVALRGLDKVGRDNPAPGELKPWDIVGDGGAGSCLW